jgi:hypothetical protein
VPDAADELRAGIDAAHAAAERLVQDAEARARAAAGSVPPRGWDVPHQPAGQAAFPDVAPLLALLEQVRGTIPPDLTAQLADAVRELLVALRALLDWYIERLEHLRSGATGGGAGDGESRIQDIPID